MQPWVLRLAPGSDLLEALEDARKAQGWTAVFVTAGIGSLHAAPLRFAGQREATTIAGPLELVSLSGTLSLDGRTCTPASPMRRAASTAATCGPARPSERPPSCCSPS